MIAASVSPSIPETGRPARIEISPVIKALLVNDRASAIVMYGRGHTALHARARAHIAFSYGTSTS